MGIGKPRGIRAGRKLTRHRKDQRWDKLLLLLEEEFRRGMKKEQSRVLSVEHTEGNEGKKKDI